MDKSWDMKRADWNVFMGLFETLELTDNNVYRIIVKGADAVQLSREGVKILEVIVRHSKGIS